MRPRGDWRPGEAPDRCAAARPAGAEVQRGLHRGLRPAAAREGLDVDVEHVPPAPEARGRRGRRGEEAGERREALAGASSADSTPTFAPQPHASLVIAGLADRPHDVRERRVVLGEPERVPSRSRSSASSRPAAAAAPTAPQRPTRGSRNASLRGVELQPGAHGDLVSDHDRGERRPPPARPRPRRPRAPRGSRSPPGAPLTRRCPSSKSSASASTPFANAAPVHATRPPSSSSAASSPRCCARASAAASAALASASAGQAPCASGEAAGRCTSPGRSRPSTPASHSVTPISASRSTPVTTPSPSSR